MDRIAFRPIEDLPAGADSLTDHELVSLGEVWAEQKRGLEERGVVEPFLERVRRRWAVEAGVVERVYTLDRGVTETLIERGINEALIPRSATSDDPERVAAIIADALAAVEGIFAFVKGERTLTTSYIKELHSLLLRNQRTRTAKTPQGEIVELPVERGEYKTMPNNPAREDGTVHEYCPPVHVAAEMDRLIEMHRRHVEAGVPPEVEAAWLHHRFTQIHPFSDGNGRVARLLASAVFLKAGWFPLEISRDGVPVYIDALERADEGNLRALVNLFARRQRLILVELLNQRDRALSLSVAEAVTSAVEVLRLTSAVSAKHLRAVDEVATKIYLAALERIQELARSLARTLRDAGFEPVLSVSETFFSDDEKLADRELGYQVNRAQYDRGCVLNIRQPMPIKISLDVHGIGRVEHGLRAVSVYTIRSHKMVIFPDTLYLNYREAGDAAEARFRPWLEAALVWAIDRWRESF
ncbi:MAG: Fic family protein [Bryobacteraceae bacterium]